VDIDSWYLSQIGAINQIIYVTIAFLSPVNTAFKYSVEGNAAVPEIHHVSFGNGPNTRKGTNRSAPLIESFGCLEFMDALYTTALMPGWDRP
jgi:hypothetical protein